MLSFTARKMPWRWNPSANRSRKILREAKTPGEWALYMIVQMQIPVFPGSLLKDG